MYSGQLKIFYKTHRPLWASRLALASILETFLLSKYEYLLVNFAPRNEILGAVFDSLESAKPEILRGII